MKPLLAKLQLIPSTSTISKRFLDFIPFVLEHEGGKYENDPDDPGGSTKWGIDIASHPFLGIVNLRNLTQTQAERIYFDSTYNGKLVCRESERTDWQKINAEHFVAKLGESHFDASLNTGVGRANRFLLASNGDVAEYINQRDAFYHRLVAFRPKSAKYLKGWLNRTMDLRKYLKV